MTIIGLNYSDEPCQSSSQLLTNRKAHPKRHLICAIISSALFFATGKSKRIRKNVRLIS
jgi:hypothetical protein